MKRILFVVGKWSNGGIEKVITTYCKYLTGAEFSFEIFAFEKEESVFTKEVEQYGIKIISPDCELYGNYITKNMRREKEFLEVVQKGYDIVHYNTSFAMAYLYCFFLKRKVKDVKVLFHSHGTGVNAPFKRLKIVFHCIVKCCFGNVPDHCLACSKPAGEWLYNKRICRSQRYEVVMNAFELAPYSFDGDARNKQREEWGVNDELVIGTIGRFDYSKNPCFVLEIIKELKKQNLKFKFIWVGRGEEKEEIIKKVKEESLEAAIIFLDETDNVPRYMSGIDVFVLPSRYEGLGIVLLEAQASGAVCLASDVIPREVKLTERIKFLPLHSAAAWSEAIQGLTDVDQRRYPEEEIAQSQFNIVSVIENMRKIYKEKL